MIPLHNIPNTCTFLRIALLPVFILAFYWPHTSSYVPACIFALAAFTDWLDGYLARSLKQISAFGAFLDPVADKLIVATALILIVEKIPWIWITLPAIIIVGREIAISALREWMAEVGKRANVKVSNLGKAKATLQMIAITLLLALPTLPTHRIDSFNTYTTIFLAGIAFLYVAAGLTLWSMMIYLRAAIQTRGN